MGKYGFEFGAKKKTAVVEQCIEQWFDAETVAGQEQGFAVAIPEGKGEHAAKAVDTAFAPGLPGMHDDFGIAPGMEYMPQCLKFGDQFLVVVDFAIEDDAD